MLALVGFTSIGVASPVAAADRAALVSLFNATNGQHWRNKTGWATTSDPCLAPWFGVTCTGGTPNRVKYVIMWGVSLPASAAVVWAP